MARPRVLTLTTDYRDSTPVQCLERCRALVAAANRGQTDALVDAVIEAIATGAIHGIYTTHLPGKTAATLNNLGAFVHAGVCSLRRCRVCGQWFLSGAKRHAVRVLCGQPACDTADAKVRASTSRARETHKRRTAVTASGTARTR